MKKASIRILLRLKYSQRLRRCRQKVLYPLFGGVKGLFWLLGAIVTLITLQQLLPDHHPTARMSGDVNVLVTPFADPVQPEFGVELSQSIARSLAATRRLVDVGGLDVQVRGPAGTDPPSGASMVRETMRQHGAQVLVYGEVGSEHGRIVVHPYLYLDPDWLVGVEEFAGIYALEPITAGSTAAGNPTAARLLVRRAIAAELAGLTDLAVGLSWFDANHMRRALVWLHHATGRTDGRFVAVTELFEGNALGKLGHFAEAEAAYLSSEIHLPGFRRARFGITEARFHRHSGDCNHGANANGLRDASATFAELARVAAGEDDMLANQALLLRARLGQARADFCLSQAGIENRWGEAEAGFRAVLRVSAERPARFRTEQAEAHGWLGFVLLPGGPGEPGANSAYREAQHQFRAARDLADDPRRRHDFAQMLAFVSRRLTKG